MMKVRHLLGRDLLQRVLSLLLFLALSGVTLFPPWSYTYAKPGMSLIQKPAPRAFILSPPVILDLEEEPLAVFDPRWKAMKPGQLGKARGELYVGVVLDFGRLAVEWLAVVFCFGALHFISKVIRPAGRYGGGSL